MPSPNQCLLDTIVAAGCGAGGGSADDNGGAGAGGVGEDGGQDGGRPSGCAARAASGSAGHRRRLARLSEDDKRALGLCWQIKVTESCATSQPRPLATPAQT